MKNTTIKIILLSLLTIPFTSNAQKYRKMLGDSSHYLGYYKQRFELIEGVGLLAVFFNHLGSLTKI